jgi:hypothetical protein
MKKEGIHWDQISAYIEGRMTPAEAHAFELEMQSDAFLSDAVDGLMQESAASRKQALQALQVKIAGKSAPRNTVFYRAAAVVLLMLGTALVFWLRFQNADVPSQVAMENAQQQDLLKDSVSAQFAPDPAETRVSKLVEANIPTPATLEYEDHTSVGQVQDAAPEGMPLHSGGSTTNIADAGFESAAGGRSIEARSEAMDAPESAFDKVMPAAADQEDMSLLYNPDVVEELLSFASSYTEPELDSKESYQSKVKRNKSVADSKDRQNDASLPPPSRGIIVKLIRDGRYELAGQEIQRMRIYYPNAPVVDVLDAALLIRLNKRKDAIARMESLKKTSYRKDAERLILRIQQ